MPRRAYGAVLFDAGGTLIAPRPSMAEIYERVLVPLGIDAGAASFRSAAAETWTEMDTLIGRGRDRYSHFPGGESEYWLRFVQGVLVRLGDGSRTNEATSALHAAFSDPAAWQVFPEARPTLARLRASGLRLGVVSNWDSRLRTLLGQLGLASEFDSIVISCEVGSEKPARAIFERALAELGVGPGEAFHVGDDRVTDFDGARSAGIDAALLVRRGDRPRGLPSIAALDELPDLLCPPVREDAAARGRGDLTP